MAEEQQNVSRIWWDGEAWLWEAVCPDGTMARGISEDEATAQCWVLMHEHPDLKVRFPPSRKNDCAEWDLRGVTPEPGQGVS